MAKVMCMDPSGQSVTLPDITVTRVDDDGRFDWISADRMHGMVCCDPESIALYDDNDVQITARQAVDTQAAAKETLAALITEVL